MKGGKRMINIHQIGERKALGGLGSQNGWGWEGHLEIFWSNSESVGKDCIQASFEYLHGWRLHNLPVQPVPALSHPHSGKEFPDVQREPPVFLFVLIAFVPVAGHRWEDPGSLIFTMK